MMTIATDVGMNTKINESCNVEMETKYMKNDSVIFKINNKMGIQLPSVYLEHPVNLVEFSLDDVGNFKEVSHLYTLKDPVVFDSNDIKSPKENRKNMLKGEISHLEHRLARVKVELKNV